MALFQKSVLANHINSITESEIISGWEKFQDYKSISENIRNYKEEEFQYKFLEMLFVDCLGYKISDVGDEKRNLFTEVKNVSDSKKADGAIKKDDEVIAVIELKSTKTKDFKTIEEQAFGYKVNQPKCKYVITSNFEKLRFYINNATEFEEFDLFNLNQNDFKLLHVCLHIDNIFNGIPEKLKTDSVFEEEKITKKLYKDYSDFRNQVFNNLVENNSEHNELLLFNKTQKLLDRFLFIFFAEDRNLVPANSISKIITKWESDIAFGDKRSLYSIFKQYFHVLNVGRPARGEYESIFAYNGGLFSEDEVLDNIKIDDKILLRHTKNLSHYDFESDVSVNILGHIFEHSLSEIEEIQNEISGLEIATSKRKKDGVFYTPQYITKYIVENSLGKLCEEKKIELNINEETYAPANKRSRERIQTLENYRNWLLGLTICDPACGSGAFLNQALNFLIEEHKYIDELSASYNKDSLLLSDVKSSILENNLFGVDINEESVEIAKLSLWLRTAEKGRKLTSLNNNIKCGNSLIDLQEIAGDKTFNWHNEFPKVFSQGGFDIVIGNPPYIRAENIEKKHREYFISKKSKYEKTFGRFDIYIVFNELAIQILKPNGFLSYIFPSSFFNQNYSSKQRDWLLNDLNLIEICDLSNIDVFKGVNVDTAIVIVKNQLPTELIKCSKPKNLTEFLDLKTSKISKEIFNNLPNKTYRADLNKLKVSLITKIREKSNLMENFCYTVIGAVPHNSKTGASKDRLISFSKTESTFKKYLEGKNVNRYSTIWDGRYLNYIPSEMHRPKFPELFENEKLLIRNISTSEGIMATFDNNHYYVNDTMSISIPWFKLKEVNQRGVNGSEQQNKLSSEIDLKYLLGLINSKLINYYFKLILSSNLHVYPDAIRNLPIIITNKQNQNQIKDWVDLILKLKNNLEEDSQKFQRTIQRKFELDKITKKLKEFYLLSFKDFLKQLTKNKIKLSLSEESDWEDFFLKEKQIALDIKTKINATNSAINKMVYELYDLNEEEIDMVENMNVS